jgi:hypothetical protein
VVVVITLIAALRLATLLTRMVVPMRHYTFSS